MRLVRGIFVLGLSFLMAVSLIAPLGAQENLQGPRVFIDDELLEPDVLPRIEEGRTLVEMRSIFETLGAALEWDEEERRVRASKDDVVIELTIDDKIAHVNGEEIPLDVAAGIENGRTVIPLRFVSESLGAKVLWDGDTRTVYVATPDEEGKIYPEVELEEFPAEIEEWVEYSRNMYLAQAREYDDNIFLLVTYGEKPTGGYSVEITEILEYQDEIVVTAKFTQPAEGEPVSQAFTYPYDIKVIKATDKPIRFVAEGDEEYLPSLFGLDYLLPIAAESRGIKVFSPEPGAHVPSSFKVEGVANVFEGNVLYSLTDEDGQELVSGFTTGAMGDWGYINPELDLPPEVEEGDALLLELYTKSAKDGSIEDLIEIELVFQEE